MSHDHKQARLSEAAMERLEPHIHTAPDGTLHLDVGDGHAAGIEDPVIFADLKRSLEETNKIMIETNLRVGDVIGVQ
jgi:hypothetical protein